MKAFTRATWVIVLAFPLFGGVSAPATTDLLHLGDDSYARGNFPEALKYYQQAEKDTMNPGLVAFDEAATLYRLGKFSEAELHYLRCLEEARGETRSRILYNLGNTLVQQAQDNDIDLLKRAIGFYQDSLTPEADPAFQQDALHNLKFAKELLALASSREKPDQPNSPNQGSGNNSNGTKDDQDQPGKGSISQGSPEKATPEPFIKPLPGEYSNDPISTSKLLPGIGNLPPIPDEDSVVPLSAEETKAYLEQAAARIARERQENRQRYLPSMTGDLFDW